MKIYQKFNIRSAGLSFVMIMFLSALSAQVDTARLNMSFTPKLVNFQKINQDAAMTDSAKQKLTFEYEVTPMKPDLAFAPAPIKSTKLAPEPRPDDLFRNYIKVGFGYPVTPLIELSMHNRDNKKYSYGLNFHHFSSWAPQIGNQKMMKKKYPDVPSMKQLAYYPSSDTRVHLFFNRFYKNQTLYSAIDYNHELNRLYGFNTELYPLIDFKDKALPYKDMLNNNYNYLHGEVGVRSNYTLEEKKLKQDVRLCYDLIHTHHLDMENHLGIKSFFAYDARFMKVSGFQNYRIDVNMDYWNNQWAMVKGQPLQKGQNSYKIELIPSVNFTIKEYMFKLGIGVPFISTPGETNGKLRVPVYPKAEVQLGIIPGIMSIDAGVTGEIEYNSLQSLLDKNPYLKPNLNNTEFTKTQISIYGGIKGNLVKSLNYRIMARYSFVNNMAIFVLDTTSVFKNQFDVQYKNGNILNVSLNLNWEVVDHLQISLDANYYGYYNFHMGFKRVDKNNDTLNVTRPWYMPSATIALGLKYRIKEKFLLSFSSTLAFDRWAMTPIYGLTNGVTFPQPESYNAIKMKPILDFNFGLEYLITKQFSAFMNLNNMGCQYYGKFYNFNNFGLNVLVGITYSFGKESIKPIKKGK